MHTGGGGESVKLKYDRNIRFGNRDCIPEMNAEELHKFMEMITVPERTKFIICSLCYQRKEAKTAKPLSFGKRCGENKKLCSSCINNIVVVTKTTKESFYKWVGEDITHEELKEIQLVGSWNNKLVAVLYQWIFNNRPNRKFYESGGIRT